VYYPCAGDGIQKSCLLRTSLNCLLDAVGVPVVGAVPPVVPELVLALNQPLAGTKGNGLYCFWPLTAHILLLVYQPWEGEADPWHVDIPLGLVALHQGEVQGGGAQEAYRHPC